MRCSTSRIRSDSVSAVYRVKHYGNVVPPVASDGERRLFFGSDADTIGDLRVTASMWNYEATTKPRPSLTCAGSGTDLRAGLTTTLDRARSASQR